MISIEFRVFFAMIIPGCFSYFIIYSSFVMVTKRKVSQLSINVKILIVNGSILKTTGSSTTMYVIYKS